MFNYKKIKLSVVILSAAIMATFTFPMIQSNAAPSTMDQVNQIFQQVTKQKPPTTPPTPTTPDKPIPATPTTPDQSNLALVDRIIATGEKYLGTPYQFGAPSGQTKTFDCSSFTQYVFKLNGISLLRSSRQQYTQGTSVARNQLQKGDLLFFTLSSSGGKIGHVGIYAGNNKILNTWGSRGVHYDSLDAAWLKQGYVGAKRVIK
jgi:cell wall-associated NlpC family hydrolase